MALRFRLNENEALDGEHQYWQQMAQLLSERYNLLLYERLMAIERCPARRCKFSINGILKRTPDEFAAIKLNETWGAHAYETHGMGFLMGFLERLASLLFSNLREGEEFFLRWTDDALWRQYVSKKGQPGLSDGGLYK